MTYHYGPSIRPEVGGCYELRAGLHALIGETKLLCGVQIWRGTILETGAETFWWTNGHYSTDPNVHLELDIMAETIY